jgi:hypothetical protein
VIQYSDRAKAQEIAHYMGQNPSFQLGIDGSDQQRVNSVHEALTSAGVPAHKIHVGGYGDPQLRRDNRVAVLLIN